MLQCEVVDLRMAFARSHYGSDCVSMVFRGNINANSKRGIAFESFLLLKEKLRPAFLETLAQKLPQFEAFLDEKQWLTGEKVSQLSTTE